MLQFQMELEDSHSGMCAQVNLMIASKSYLQPKEKKQPRGGKVAKAATGDPAGGFKKALEEVAEMRIPIPPVLLKAQFIVLLDACRSAMKVGEALSLMADSRYKQTHSAAIERETTENFFTDKLRALMQAEAKTPAQPHLVDQAKRALAELVNTLASSTISSEIRGEVRDIIVLVDPNEHSLEEVRAVERKVNEPKADGALSNIQSLRS